MHSRTAALVLVPALGLASVAAGAELFSSPLVVVDGLLECRILNVGKKPLTVRAEVIGTSDTAVDDTGEVTLPPLGNVMASAGAADSPFFCRFTVQGGKSAVRASASHRTASGTVLSVPAE